MDIQALDEAGKPVDWWFIYKVPKLTRRSTTGEVVTSTGYEYVYYDPTQDRIAPSDLLLDHGKGALNDTLNAVFRKPPATTGWILYNDEMPDDAERRDNGNLGHSKGVIAFDVESKSALWLLHSWPKYADPGASTMPTPVYGQTYLCISITLDTAVELALKMIDHQEPQVYLPHLPPALPKGSGLYRLTQSIDANAAASSIVADYKSRMGVPFKVIAKNKKWNDDFWNDLVGPKLGEDMDVETWIRGDVPAILDADGVHRTYDIKYIDFRPLGVAYAWPETQDHAKWGITKKNHWVVVGDINRMITQRQRGGGAIALQDPKLWNGLKLTEFVDPPRGLTQEQATAILKSTADAERERAGRMSQSSKERDPCGGLS